MVQSRKRFELYEKNEMKINVILFPGFETLDVFGPVEIFGKVDNCRIGYYSQNGGIITNNDGIKIETTNIEDIKQENCSVLFVPGGMGTRKEINNDKLLIQLKELAENSPYVLSVCTGSALLAKTGILDGKKATSNKRSFDWVRSCSEKVDWIRKARWVTDGKFYTSSGVSAGIDMTLGFIADVYGKDVAKQIAFRIEYKWVEDNNDDYFYNQ